MQTQQPPNTEQNAAAAPSRGPQAQPYTPPPTRPSLDDFAHCLSLHLAGLERLRAPKGPRCNEDPDYSSLSYGVEHPAVFNSKFWTAVRQTVFGAVRRSHPGDSFEDVKARVALLQHAYAILTPVAGRVMEVHGILGRYTASVQLSLGTTVRQIERTLLDVAYLDTPPAADWAPDDARARQLFAAAPTASLRQLHYAMHHEERAWKRFFGLLEKCFIFSKKGIGAHSHLYFLMDSNIGTTFLMNPPA